jgi:hypothetical protein
MDKISISNIVAFRRKSENSQITFINNLRKTKPESSSEGGGDYWIHSLSTVSNVFKGERKELLNDKMEILREKHDQAGATISKNMFQRNINILSDFENFNFKRLKPKSKLEYLPRPKDKSILIIKGIPIQVLPHHVFIYDEEDIKKIGAVWFVAKLNGYRIEELAMFTDALYRYLKHTYSKKYEVSPDHCIAVDAMTLNKVAYAQLLNKDVPALLISTLDSINKVLGSTP